MKVTNLALLVVRGVPRDRADGVATGRGGVARGEAEGLPVFGFTSPTDAVLAALELALDDGACSGVAAGEVEERDGRYHGKAVVAAAELASRGPARTALLVEAVYFAMNRNEVSASLMEAAPANCLEQRVYQAARRAAVDEPAPAKPPTEASAASPRPVVAGAVWAFLAGAALVGLLGLARGGETLVDRAQALARQNLHREAAHAYYEAYLENPGMAEYEREFRRELLAAVAAARRQGRPDAGYQLLKDGLRRDPFREDLESALLEVGMEYLQALLTNGSQDAFDLERGRLIESLPLQERSIRDQVVGIHARRLVAEWRKESNGRLRGDIARKTAPLWDESPDNPELMLAEAEFSADSGRIDSVVRLLTKVLDRFPEWARSRDEVGAVVERSFRGLGTGYYRQRYQADLIGFVVQRLGDHLVPKATELLAAEDVGVRSSVYRYLERLGKLPAGATRAFTLRTLTNVHDAESREGPLADELLRREALAVVRAAKGDDLRAYREALTAAVALPGLDGDVVAELRAAATELGSAGE